MRVDVPGAKVIEGNPVMIASINHDAPLMNTMSRAQPAEAG
jgi:hypothetical protein